MGNPCSCCFLKDRGRVIMVYRNIKTGIEFSTNCVIKSEDCVEVKASAQTSDTTTEAPKAEKKTPTSKGKKKNE